MLYNTQNPHGGDVYGAAVTLDFSSNVHPLGTPPGVVEAIRAAAAQVRQYPDPYCRALTAAIAAHEGVPQPYVLCARVWRPSPRRRSRNTARPPRISARSSRNIRSARRISCRTRGCSPF